ncbi:hypothetical protein R1sor_014446 [Riccia sorocarpa]|uniref:Uncharacterized protein n=1 Tax=Riccia sorocarpa TaxID=122646 RepID=A0ABD3HCF5_9MARC
MEETDRTENALDVTAAPSGSRVKSEPISTATETHILEQLGGDVSVQANSAQPSGGTVVGSEEVQSGEDWEEEAFYLSVEHFEKECKLPSHGIHHAEIPKSLITDEQLVACFGSKAGKNRRNGHRWDLSKVIPPADILSLVHERPTNGTIGVIFPRVLYAERILGQKINWAAFAHDKLKNQLRTHKTRKFPKPTGPPCIRVARVYSPPPSLTFSDSEDKVLPCNKSLEGVGGADDQGKGKLRELSSSTTTVGSLATVDTGCLAAPNACSDLSAEPPDVRSMAVIQIENTDILRSEIKQHEKTKMCLGSALTQLKDSQSRLSEREEELASSIHKYESTISSEVLKQGDLVKKESELNRRKSEIVMLLEPDDCFDEDDLKELDRVMQLENDKEQVNDQISQVLDSIADSKSVEKRLRDQLESTKKQLLEVQSETLQVVKDISANEKKACEEQVERDWKVSSSASKVRSHHWASSAGGVLSSQADTPTSTPGSSNAHQLVAVKVEEEQGPVGKTSGSKKRKGVKGSEDLPLCPRKVKTRHATKSEIGTGIGSPSQCQSIILKSYKAIDTPPAILKSKDSRRKLSLDKVRQRRFSQIYGV